MGLPVIVPPVISRVVSLVPSLTETVASCAPGLLVGATNWCTHPADLAVTRIGGTKNPDVGRIVALRPDVVLANEEENRQPDLDALRAAGLAVWVTRIRDLPEALASLRRMITLACRQPGPAWLDAAELGLAAAARRSAAWPRSCRSGGGRGWCWAATPSPAICWPASASPTCTPATRTATRGWTSTNCRQRGADLVVLPDEPYRFTASDGPEAFPGSRTALVSGRHLTWYGPSLTEAPAVLRRQLAAARVR